MSRLNQLEEMQRSVEHFYLGQNHVRTYKFRNENNESGAGFQKRSREAIEMVQPRVMRGDEEHILREVLPELTDLEFQSECSSTIS